MEKTRVVIADDHQIVVEGLAAMINNHDDFTVCGTANDMRQCVTQLRECTPDILLTDLNMPGKNGVPMLNELREQFPFLKIIVLTMYYDVRLMKELEGCEINGFMMKNSTSQDLIDALSAVKAGNLYKHPKLESLDANYDFAISMNDEIKDAFSRQYSLGNRELEVLMLVALGKSSPEIAESLHISVETVSTHRKNLKYKIGLKNSAEIAAFAVRNQLI